MALLTAATSDAQIDPTLHGNCETGIADAYLDVGNVRARLLNNGNLFWGAQPRSYEVPKGSGNHSIFNSSVFIGGFVSDELRVATSTYGPFEFWPGPIETPGIPSTNCHRYDAIWSIDRERDLIPAESGMYNTNISSWPVELGAPFEENNGVPGYQYEDGDVPMILGDQMHWWIMNDTGGEHIRTDSNPLGVEVRVSAFAFGTRSDLRNVTFYRYHFLNRSSNNYSGVYVGQFIEADIGKAHDDRFASDSTLSLVYFYNADNDDEGGYGIAPPAQGVTIIEASHSRGGLPSNVPNSGSDSFMTHAMMYWGGGGIQGDPQTGIDYYNHMRSRWRDNSFVTKGNLGQNRSGKPIRMMFPGDPVAGVYWSEVNLDGLGDQLRPGDRNGTGSFGPFDLNSGESVTFTFAYVWARGEDNLDSISQMKRLTKALHDTRESILSPRVFPDKFVDANASERPHESFWLDAPFPNPSSDTTTIKFSLSLDGPTEIAVYDVLSRKVAAVQSGFLEAGQQETTLDTSKLRPGVYTIRLFSNRNSASRQITVVR